MRLFKRRKTDHPAADARELRRLDEMIDAAGERVREAETAYRRALPGSDWTHVTNSRRDEEEKMRERAALFESMSDAGRAWYDRIIRDERDRALHNERATAQAKKG